MQAYDQIMLETQDVPTIAKYYQLSLEDVKRAKNYAFGQGVSQYQFSPEILMAEAWYRMKLNQGNQLDEVLLRHEIYESDLVLNQGLPQSEAHKLTQTKYPWSDLLIQSQKE
ncbi:MAG: hypothetical protein ACKN9E_09855 [Microcystaceae cyanobacterium]